VISARSDSASRLINVFIPAIIFLCLLFFYFFRIQQTVHDPILADCLLGSDTNLRSKVIVDHKIFLSWGFPRRHPLSVVPTILVAAPLRAIGWMPIEAIMAGLATAQAFGAVCLYLFFRSVGCTRISAALGAVIANVVYSVVAIGSALDTHGTSFAGLCFVVFALSAFARRTSPTVQNAIFAGLISSVGGLGNGPSAAFALLYPAVTRTELSWRRRLTLTVICSMTAVGLSAGLPLAMDVVRHGDARQYIQEWASITNFWTIDYLKHGLTVLAYSFVSPLSYATSYYRTEMVAGYLERPHALIALVALWLAFTIGFIRLWRDMAWRYTLVVLVAVLLILLVFYIYFDPLEAALFTPALALPIVVPLTIGLHRMQWGWCWLAALAVLLAWANIPAFRPPFASTKPCFLV
jgi:hypothetical protein